MTKSNTKLNLALAAILTVAAQGAVAAPTVNNTLYLSGATASDRTLFEGLLDSTNGVCDSTNPVTVYSTASTATSTATNGSIPTSYGTWEIQCTARDTTTFGAAAEIAVNKSSQGSEYGIDPVANGATTVSTPAGTVDVKTLDITNCTGGSTSVGADATNTRLAYTHTTGCGIVTSVVPQAGISDVEPALFGASAAIKAKLNVFGAAVVPFTMFVSKNFYRALQTAQGLSSLTVGAAGAACSADTAANQTEACTPNLSMVQVRAILSQYVSNVNKIYSGSTAISAPAGGGTILVCRRANTSGSQKSVERLFFNQNCKATPAVTFATDSNPVNGSSLPCLDVGCTWADTALTAGGVADGYVFQGVTTGDVENCMNFAARTDATGAAANGGGVYAVGIASADRAPNDTSPSTSSSKLYRYIKIDGVLPTVENVVAGKWQHTIENVVLTPTSSSTTNYAAYNLGARSNIAAALLAQLRTPANLAKTHSTSYAMGRIGLTTRPSTLVGALATDTASVRPVAPFIRATTRSNPPVSNCNENFIAPSDPVRF